VGVTVFGFDKFLPAAVKLLQKWKLLAALPKGGRESSHCDIDSIKNKRN
jgi:hypothetical protein